MFKEAGHDKVFRSREQVPCRKDCFGEERKKIYMVLRKTIKINLTTGGRICEVKDW